MTRSAAKKPSPATKAPAPAAAAAPAAKTESKADSKATITAPSAEELRSAYSVFDAYDPSSSSSCARAMPNSGKDDDEDEEEKEFEQDLNPPLMHYGRPVKMIPMTKLMVAANRALLAGRCLLVLDPSERMNTFMGYQFAQTIDAKMYLMQKVRGEKTVPEIMEDLRLRLVTALKTGQLLWVAMTNSATDFKEQFAGPSFPPEVFDPVAIKKEEVLNKFVKDSEKQHGFFNAQFPDLTRLSPKRIDGFRTIVTSQFQVEDYQDFLKNALPLFEEMEVRVIQPEKEQQ